MIKADTVLTLGQVKSGMKISTSFIYEVANSGYTRTSIVTLEVDNVVHRQTYSYVTAKNDTGSPKIQHTIHNNRTIVLLEDYEESISEVAYNGIYATISDTVTINFDSERKHEKNEMIRMIIANLINAGYLKDKEQNV